MVTQLLCFVRPCTLQRIFSLPRTVVRGMIVVLPVVAAAGKRGALVRTSSPTTSTGSGERLVGAVITTCLYLKTSDYNRRKRVDVWLTK